MMSFYRALLPRYRLKRLYRRYRWTRLTGVNCLLVIGFLFVAGGCVLIMSVLWTHLVSKPWINNHGSDNAKNDDDIDRANNRVYVRRLLADDNEQNILVNSSYPHDLFSKTQLRHGAIVVHVFVMIYMFVALAIVCDEFFVPALEVIIERLGISDDVAGATFMAAGGSAPELFTSLIGVFIAKSDVGIGTIVGSAVFNILFVIGMCSFFSKTVLQLTWWPLARDCTFYTISIIALIIFFRDAEIYWYEALVLFSCYIAYVVFMKYNENVEAFVKTKCCNASSPPERKSTISHKQRPSIYVVMVSRKNSKEKMSEKTTASTNISGNAAPELDNPSTQVSTANPSAASVTRSPGRRISDASNMESGLNSSSETSSRTPDMVLFNDGFEVKTRTNSECDNEEMQPMDMTFPECTKDRIIYLYCLPITFTLWITVPDVRNPKWTNCFMLTFILSILWIAVYSYVMVWMAETFGAVIDIPTEVMGLSILAAGTSIPDLITSVIVAKKGHGDMAVSSSVGSNIFDITVGLPVPWMLYAFINHFEPFKINSKGLFCSIFLLLFMLVAVVVSIASCNWQMSKWLGGVMMVLYAVFLTVAILLEYEVFKCPIS